MLEEVQKNFERIIALYESERETVKSLQRRLSELESENVSYREQIKVLEGKIENLKLAEAFLTPDCGRDEAKARIAKLIKEINKCISMLQS